MHQHMPWLVLTTMLAFPLIVGLGGFLTAGGSPFILAAIAALPGLSVLVVVAAMGHEILRVSSEGEGDVPNLPDYGNLVTGARGFLGDAAITFAIFFGLPTTLALVGAPLVATLPVLAVGVLFAPLAFALRQVRRDFRTFSPAIMLRAIGRCGVGYPVVAAAVAIAFAPAFAVAFATMSKPVWVQIAIIGPLCVLPTFASARLLGSWLDTHRDSLGYLLLGREATVAGSKDKPKVAVEAVATATQPRNLRRPTAQKAQQTPQPSPVAKRPTTAKRRVQPASALGATRQRKPAARAIEGRRPAPARPAAPARAAAPAKPTSKRPAARRPLREEAVSHAAPANSHVNDGPDLGSMPGAVVVKGSDRARQGAASRRG